MARFIDPPIAPRTGLPLNLVEWITGESVTAAAAVSRLDDTERSRRYRPSGRHSCLPVEGHSCPVNPVHIAGDPGDKTVAPDLMHRAP